MDKVYKVYYSTEIGVLEIVSDEESVLAINFVENEGEATERPEILKKAYEQVVEYFEGKRKEFDLKLFFKGTDFQRKVWQELTRIPYGESVSYRNIAEAIGNEKAVRAVGSANGRNAIPIVVPCHRVIGSSGKLTGYAGGLWRKEWLLRHESKCINK